MFDPKTGRFLQRDPRGFEAGDANLYRYVSNGPVNWVDPDGTQEASSAQKPKSPLERIFEDAAKQELERQRLEKEKERRLMRHDDETDLLTTPSERIITTPSDEEFFEYDRRKPLAPSTRFGPPPPYPSIEDIIKPQPSCPIKIEIPKPRYPFPSSRRAIPPPLQPKPTLPPVPGKQPPGSTSG